MSLPPLDRKEVNYRRLVERYENEVMILEAKRRASIIYTLLLDGAMIECVLEQQQQKKISTEK